MAAGADLYYMHGQWMKNVSNYFWLSKSGVFFKVHISEYLWQSIHVYGTQSCSSSKKNWVRLCIATVHVYDTPEKLAIYCARDKR